MSLRAELIMLRERLDDLASQPDESFAKRYVLRQPPLPPGFYWQLRWLAGRILRGLQALHVLPEDPWPASLRQAATGTGAEPLLIWAVGTDRDTLREACHGFSRLHVFLPGFAPVLVTDVADFAFFSRLGWLVEYLPQLAGQGEPYDQGKARLLARLYRGAPALPVLAGLECGSRAEEIRQWVAPGD